MEELGYMGRNSKMSWEWDRSTSCMFTGSFEFVMEVIKVIENLVKKKLN